MLTGTWRKKNQNGKKKPLIGTDGYAYLGRYQELRAICYILAIKIFQRASIQKEALSSKVDKVIVCATMVASVEQTL